MTEETITKIYFMVYFWLLLTVQTILVVSGPALELKAGIINIIMTYTSFIPLYGYAYDKKISTKTFWQVFAVIFLLWEISCYVVIYDNPFHINLLSIVMQGPLYWGVVMYGVITMEESAAKKALFMEKRDYYKERFKSIFVIGDAFAMLLLILFIIAIIT